MANARAVESTKKLRRPQRRAIAKAGAYKLEIKRVFDAPRSAVFRALTDPARLARWYGPKGFRIPSCAVDLRVGGRYRIVMRSPDGVDHCVVGTYREIEPPSLLVHSWAWESDPASETLVTIRLRDRGKRTELHLVHEGFVAAKARDMHQQGWTGCLDCLEPYLFGMEKPLG